MTDARKQNVALERPYHEGKWCTKFGWILPSSLGDCVTDRTGDRRTDWRTHGKIMFLSHTQTMKESDVASLVEFRPVVKEECDRQMDVRRTDGWTDAQKNNVLLHSLTMRGSNVASLVEFPPSGLGWDSVTVVPLFWHSLGWVFSIIKINPNSTFKIPTSSLWNKENSVQKHPKYANSCARTDGRMKVLTISQSLFFKKNRGDK